MEEEVTETFFLSRAVSKAIESVQDIDRVLFDEAIMWDGDMKK